MKTIFHYAVAIGTLWCAGFATPVSAQNACFFRIAGPAPTAIAEIRPDGFVTWVSLVKNVTVTIQAATTLGGEANWTDYVQVPVSNYFVTQRLFDPVPPAGMVFVPAGSFTMGDAFNEGRSNERPAHDVYVSAFYMDKHEVTKALWDEVFQWATNHGYSFDQTYSGQGKATQHPAHSMTWYDAVKWCNARSEREGRSPAYYTSAAQLTVYRTGRVSLRNDWVKWNTGYRLPTEAEWEKAARGGAESRRFPWRDEDNITHSRANYYSSSAYAWDTSPTRGYHPAYATGSPPYTSPAGSFAANGYGLHDVSGNVWEWCWDGYQSDWYSHADAAQSDTHGPAETFTKRVLRGGCWAYDASQARPSYRFDCDPTYSDFSFGFRCVKSP